MDPRSRVWRASFRFVARAPPAPDHTDHHAPYPRHAAKAPRLATPRRCDRTRRPRFGLDVSLAHGALERRRMGSAIAVSGRICRPDLQEIGSPRPRYLVDLDRRASSAHVL